MSNWPDTRLLELFGIQQPIIQGPLAGVTTLAMLVGVARAGGLASLPAAMLTAEQIRQHTEAFRRAVQAPLNINFFCHPMPTPDPEREKRWKERLAPYYREQGLDFNAPTPVSSRAPFDEGSCQLVEELRPEIVSFHFGLPPQPMLDRVKATGATLVGCATTVDEALWLQERGCHAIIAMGVEAGGHRGIFLSNDLNTQVGTMALVPQIVDAVKVPVIAAGGIGDARGIAAAFMLGASAAQLGTSYLFTPEAKVSASHHQALRTAKESETALTNLFTGRPARGIMNRVMRELGPISDMAPAFPLAGGALMPLRAKAEADFSNLWSGQALRLGVQLPAEELTRQLAQQALARLQGR